MTTKNQEQLKIVYRYFTWNIRKRESVDLQQNNVKSRKSQFTINLHNSVEMMSHTTQQAINIILRIRKVLNDTSFGIINE